MRRLFVVSLVMACASSGAVAQDADPGAETGAGEIALDAITVTTATRADRELADVPQSVQVIDRAEIEEQLEMTSSASEVLSKLIPGFSVANETISGASESFRGRGLLVMIDGVPLNTPLRDVSRLLSLVDLHTVERIEVVAGASSLYGSGATGGTVNFITRKGEGAPFNADVDVSLRGFTHDLGDSLSPEISATVSGAKDGFDYLVTGTGQFASKTYDGAGRELPSDGMLGQGGGDRFDEGNLYAKLGYQFDEARRLDVSAFWVYLDQDPKWLTAYGPDYAQPDFSEPYPGQSVLENTKSFSVRYTDEDFALGKLSILGYYNDIKKRFNYTDYDPTYNNLVYFSGDASDPTAWFNQTELYSDRLGVNATVDTPLTGLLDGWTLTWGADVTYEKTYQQLVNGEDVFTPLEQYNYAGFAQLQIPIGDRLTLRGGARYEYLDLEVSDFDRPDVFYGVAPGLGYVLPELHVTGGDFNYDALTFNLGATFELTDTVELHGGFSQGFALPDVGAFTRRAGASLAYACPVPNTPCSLPPGTSVGYGNIAPEAQIVNNYELGIRGSLGRVSGSVAGFISTSKDGVTFDSRTNELSQQKEIIYGVEATGEVRVTDQLVLGGIFTYREGKYDSDGDGDIDAHLPNNRIATPFRGTLYGNYFFDNGAMVRLEGEFWSDRDVFDGDGRYPIDGGATMNVSASHPLAGGQAYASVSNLFDATVENPTATATRNLTVYSWGRTVTVGYRRAF